MLMPGRKYSAESGYRYGFNGKEIDNETQGDGNQYNYGFRIYNPKLGKFMSIDPLTNGYPMLTPYQFASNSPIAGVDLDGLEFYFAVDGTYLGQSKSGGTQIRVAVKWHVNPENKQNIVTEYREINEVDETIASLVYSTIYKREIKNGKATKVTASSMNSSGAAETNVPKKEINVFYKKRMDSDDGSRPILMSDYYNAASALSHEEEHVLGVSDDGFSHFKIGVREAQNKFQNKVNKYYKENLINNMKKYLRDQVNHILEFEEKGDIDSAKSYRQEYEENIKTFNRLFDKNIKSFFEVIKNRENKSKDS